MSTASGPVPGQTPQRENPQRPRPTGPSRAPLRVVAPRSTAMPRTPFVVALVALLGVGLVGLLLLNTAMQRRAFALTSLEQRAAALDVQAAALTMRTDRLASPQRLALQASELGMVPNTNPVFLRLSDGRVVGDPVPASSAASIPGLLPAPPTVTEPTRHAAGDARSGDARPAGTTPGGTAPGDTAPGDTAPGGTARDGTRPQDSRTAAGDDAPTRSQQTTERAGGGADGTRAHDRAGGRQGSQADSQGAQ